jgi:RimJ/RimL family protein N-acetyltransferase
MIPKDLVLETVRVILRPVVENDADDFWSLAQDKEAWKYFTLDLSNRDHLRKWMDMALREKEADTRRPFTIIDKASGRIAGSTSMGNISWHDLRLEIGWSWLGKDFRSTGINRHAKYSMMKYSFETLGFERIEFKTDVLNLRARQGLKNIGGMEEGVLRSHMTMWNNRRRDSIYFSVLKEEWPGLKRTVFQEMEEYENR